MARTYPVRKGTKLSTESIMDTLRQYTNDVSSNGNEVIASLPGIRRFTAALDGKGISIETVSDPSFKESQLSVKIYNEILEKLTGYTSKERKKLFSKL